LEGMLANRSSLHIFLIRSSSRGVDSGTDAAYVN